MSSVLFAFTQTISVNSDGTHSLIHSTPRTRPGQLPSISAQTTRLLSSPKSVRRRCTTLGQSSSGSGATPNGSRCSNRNSQKGPTRAVGASRCTRRGPDGYSDVIGAWNMLQQEVWPMARPAALSVERDRDVPTDGAYWQWNEHDWILADFGEQSRSVDQPSVSKPASSQPG